MKSNSDFAAIHLEVPPRRIVSLVPSVTESLFELGAGDRVVGITDYCVHPAQAVAGLPRVGGTKNPHAQRISGLKPDLVIANREENTRESVEALQALGLRVWVTFPRSIQEAVELLWGLVRLLDLPHAVPRLEMLERTLDWARGAAVSGSPDRVFCPIWRDTAWPPVWWMTANRETYLHDVLAVCGGANVFADRRRHYPLAADLGHAEPLPHGAGDIRYPRVSPEEVIAQDPEVILLPSEPYAFGEADRELVLKVFSSTTAGQSGRVRLCDGSLLTWHGTRLARALQEIPVLLAPIES